VILFHEGQEWTLEALPRIVRRSTLGLECVTMFDRSRSNTAFGANQRHAE